MTPSGPPSTLELRALSADLPLMPELTPEVVAMLRGIPSAPLDTSSRAAGRRAARG